MTTAAAAPPQPSTVAITQSQDELVVLQLLEEIHQLVNPARQLPSNATSLRQHAAARLYLDTRDTFEVIEYRVEGPTQQDRPKFLRRLSKRRGLAPTPRESLVASPEEHAEIAAHAAGESVHSPRHLSGAPPNSPITPRLSIISASSSAAATTPRERMSIISQALQMDQLQEPLNEAIIDRIQDMFRHLGELLSRPILDEVRHRNLSIQSVLHYVRFLPAESQWTAYVEKREEEAEKAYVPPAGYEPPLRLLKRNAEFVKEQIRKDLNTVCLFAPDGTLSTIFGDDINSDQITVSEKFELLIEGVYAKYLRSAIEGKMDYLVRLSEQWQQDMVALTSSPIATDSPHAQLYTRVRKFRSKIPIFPHMTTGIEDNSLQLPPIAPGQPVRLLVADTFDVGLWWQKTVLTATDRDITTSHTDEQRGIHNATETLDGGIYVPLMFDSCAEFLRRYAKNSGFAKWQGHRILVNNGKDSLWVEVTVLEVEDRKCKLQLKKSLENRPEVASWKRYLSENEWIHLKDLRLCMAPLNPSFRIQMGYKFRVMLDAFQLVIVEISSIFPNENLERRVSKSLWHAVESAVSRGEHIYARYFRSVLNHEWQPRRHTPARHLDRSASVVAASASVRNLVAALEHSANQAGSVSGAVGGYASNGGRFSFSTGSQAVINLGRAVEFAYFDNQGTYRHQLYVPDLPVRTSGHAMSDFDKLAHHLLEEKELIGSCIQASNVAVARAFAQVLQEKLTRLLRALQMRLEQEDSSSLDIVVTEYANACRFQCAWALCRDELDLSARRQRGKKESESIHAEWVDRCFDRMESIVSAMIRLQLQFLQRVFFHECTSYILPGIFQQDWRASKPWFSNSRCSHSVQFFIYRIASVLDSIFLKVVVQYERSLRIDDKLYEAATWLILDAFACVATAYETMVVSRARLTQWKIDVIYLFTGVHRLLQLLDRLLASSAPSKEPRVRRKQGAIAIREIGLRLLASFALRSGPADVVVHELRNKADSENPELSIQVDAITEWEVHHNAIVASIGVRHERSSAILLDEEERSQWTSHSIFGDSDPKCLADVQLNWTALISRSSFRLEEMLACVRHRHELGNWEFPALTDAELRSKAQIGECIAYVEDKHRRRNRRLPEHESSSRRLLDGSGVPLSTTSPRTLALSSSSSSSRSLRRTNSSGKKTPMIPMLEGAGGAVAPSAEDQQAHASTIAALLAATNVMVTARGEDDEGPAEGTGRAATDSLTAIPGCIHSPEPPRTSPAQVSATSTAPAATVNPTPAIAAAAPLPDTGGITAQGQ